MRQLLEVIRAIFRLGRSANTIGMDTFHNLHRRFVARTIWILVVLLTVMVGLNYYGLMGVNLLISLILCVMTIIVGTWPEPILATLVWSAGSGIVRSPQTITSEIERIAPLYVRTLGDILLWTSIFGLFLGTVPCHNNPGAILLVAVSLIIMGYGSWRWKMGHTIYKRVIYTYACGAFVVAVLSLVPAHIWIHWTGHDLGSTFRVSKTEEALSAVEAVQERTEDEANAKMLQSIEAKVASGQKLTKEEENFLVLAKAVREKESIPSSVKATASELKAKMTKVIEPKPAAPDPAPAPKKAEKKVTSAPKVEVAQQSPPPVAKPAVAIWNVRYFQNGQLMEQNYELTKVGNVVTLSAADGTRIVVSSAGDGGSSYAGTITINNQHIRKCAINLSGSVGSGWWEDIRDIQFTLKRLS
jgi:hypothetical protein